MGNIFCFRYDPEHGPESVKDALSLSNISTAKFINVLCLSGGRLAATQSQKRMMVFLGEKNQTFCGIGTVGFDIVDMPWDRDSFDEDKAFLLAVIEGARNKLGWETLDFKPNEEVVIDALNVFEKLVQRMEKSDIREEALAEWLSGAEENDPVRCGFPKCEAHDIYLSVFGCQVCTD